MTRVVQFQFRQNMINGRKYINEVASALDYSTGELIEGDLGTVLARFTDGDRIYIFRFQIFYCILEKWALSKGIQFKSNIVEGIAKMYLGHSKKTPYIAPLILGDAPELARSKTPVCKKVRLGYDSKEITFIDIDQWIRDTPAFGTPITFEYGQECQNTIQYIIEELLPLAYKGEGKASIASLARSLFDYPALCTPIDDVEIHQDRCRYLSLIASSYTGGIYYLSGVHAHHQIDEIRCYDMRSAYPHQLLHRKLPNMLRPGEVVDGLEYDNEGDVHFYHIRHLSAWLKKSHFPSVFTQSRHCRWWGGSIAGKVEMLKTESENMPKTWDVGRGKKTPVHLLVDDEMNECFITSVDLRMLMRDYSIKVIDIDFSIRCDAVEGKTYFDRLAHFYNLKEESPKDSIARNTYKVLIDSFTGSLAMRTLDNQFMYESLDCEEGVIKEMGKNMSPIDVAAFMTAYQRWEITEYALMAGYDKVISIDTDSVFTVGKNEALEKKCKDSGLGSIHIDKVLHWCRWYGKKQYAGLVHTGQYEVHITGLPAPLWRPDKFEYEEQVPLFDTKEKYYYVDTQSFTLQKGKRI